MPDDDFLKFISKANSNPFDPNKRFTTAQGRDPFDDSATPWSGHMFSMGSDGHVGVQPTKGGDTAGYDGWGTTGIGLPQPGSSANVMAQMAKALASQQGGGWEQLLGGALGRDTNKMQGAADRQFARNNQQIGSMESSIPHWSEEILKRMFGDTALLGQGADAAHAQGQAFGSAQDARTAGIMGQNEQDFSKFREGLDPIRKGLTDQTKAGGGLDRIRGDVEEAYKLGDEAVAGFQKDIGKYEDRTAQDASVVAAGIAQRGRSMLEQAMSANNPDGTPKTPGQMASDRFAIQQQIGQETQAETTKIFSAFNENRVNLGQALASVRMNNAGLRMEGSKIGLATEQQRSQAFGQMGDLAKTELQGVEGIAQQRLAGLASYFQTDQGRREWDSIARSYREQETQIGQAATMGAVNLEMEGRVQVARMVSENPETVVSWFQGLLAMYSTMAAASGTTSVGTSGFGTRLA